jgi:hypothetical protein
MTRHQCEAPLGCAAAGEFAVTLPSGRRDVRCADHVGYALTTLAVGERAVVTRIADDEAVMPW